MDTDTTVKFHFSIGAILRDGRDGSTGRVIARAEVDGDVDHYAIEGIEGWVADLHLIEA